MIEDRLLRLKEALDANNIDAVISTHTPDIRWITGFTGVFDGEQAHCALIFRETITKSACLFTDTRYSEALRQQNTQRYWRILDERRRRFSYLAAVFAELFGVETGAGMSTGTGAQIDADLQHVVIGIESNLRLDWYRALVQALDELDAFTYELKELPSFIQNLRARKTTGEIELIRQAQAITDAAFTHILNFIKPGLTEREVATELEFFMRRAGADGMAFPVIVASGPNSAVPHAVPSGRVLQHGDFVLMDFGARLNDYCSDMTRTVFLGEADEQQQQMYTAVLATIETLTTAYQPGTESSGLQKMAEAKLAELGFAGKLIHSVGHGVGLEVHESPQVSATAADKLEVGHVLTIEPGVYLEGFGGVRIENFGYITEDGFKDFTSSTKELLVL